MTLQDIADLVRTGVDVQIIDNETQEDLTGVTLAQLLLDAEKRNDRALPLSTLTQMLRSSGTRIQKSLKQQVTVIREEAERTVTGIKKETGRQLKDLRARTNFEDLRSQIRDFVRQAHESIDDLQAHEQYGSHPDETTHQTSDDSTKNQQTSAPPEDQSTQGIDTQRLDALEKRIMILEGIVATWAPPPSETKDDGQ